MSGFTFQIIFNPTFAKNNNLTDPKVMIPDDKINISIKKIHIQKYIFFGGIILFVVKVIAFYITNSVGILSDALESTVNIITGFITLKALQFSAKPRDEDHPYGHGKVELITASIEGILIGVAGIMIITEAINRLGKPPLVTKMDVGIALMFITAIANYVMGSYSVKMGKKHHSISLISGGQHLISDTYTTLALIGGLVVFYITGYHWVDSFLAIFFGIFIMYIGYNVLKSTVNGLMDEADISALDALVTTLHKQRNPSWINIHKLTYLKFGHVSHVDFHLTLPWYYNIEEASEQIMNLKNIIRTELPEEDVDISIQSEPCKPNMCHQCSLLCKERKYEFTRSTEWTTEQIVGKNIYNIHS
jgi:cation diffusion facilitator family transporter